MAQVFDLTVVTAALQHGGDRRRRQVGVGIAHGGGALTDLEVVRADRDQRGIGAVLGGEAQPRLVDRDDDPLPVERSHVAVERAEDGAAQRVALEEHLVGGLQLGDVGGGADVTDDGAVRPEARQAVIEDPAILAVPALQAIVEGEGPARPHRVAHRGRARLTVFGMHAYGPALAHLVLEPAAGDVEPAIVEVAAPGVGIGHPHHPRRGVGHQAESLLALADAALGPAAGERVGEHLGDQAQALHQLLGPRMLGAQAAAGERAHDHAAHHQRDRHQRADTERGHGAPIGAGVLRELADARELHDLAAAEPGVHPGKVAQVRRHRQGRDARAGPAVGHTDQLAAGAELDEHGPVDVELGHDALQPVLDGGPHVARREADERGRQTGEEGLEAEPFGHRVLHASALGTLDEQSHDEGALQRDHDRPGDDGDRRPGGR